MAPAHQVVAAWLVTRTDIGTTRHMTEQYTLFLPPHQSNHFGSSVRRGGILTAQWETATFEAQCGWVDSATGCDWRGTAQLWAPVQIKGHSAGQYSCTADPPWRPHTDEQGCRGDDVALPERDDPHLPDGCRHCRCPAVPPQASLRPPARGNTAGKRQPQLCPGPAERRQHPCSTGLRSARALALD